MIFFLIKFPVKIFPVLFLSLWINVNYAQNLVPNSSFDETDSTGFLYWKRSDSKSAFSYESGKGKDMAAILIADLHGKVPNSTTYIGGGENVMAVKLKEPLAAETYYKLSMKVRQADSSLLLLNRLGVYFTDKQEPDVLLNLADVNASEDWWLLEDIFLARGGEQNLIIGRMSDIGIETSWNNRYKRKKYQSQWHLNKDGYKHKALYIIDDVMLKKVPLKPAFLHEKKFVPENILFETAKAGLSEKAENYLLLLGSFLRANPDLLISIEGFADKRGVSEENQQLSKNRAVSVANFLLNHGIEKKRIRVQWHGSEKAGSRESEYHLDRKIQLELIPLK